MEKCIFPAYARMCGDSAEKFYVGLLDTMKQSLVGEFSPLGQDIAELAKCNKKTGAKIKATPLTKVNNDAFMQYIRQQEKQYRTIGRYKQNLLVYMHALYAQLLIQLYILVLVLLYPYGRTSRVWDSLLVMKSGCAGGRLRPGRGNIVGIVFHHTRKLVRFSLLKCPLFQILNSGKCKLQTICVFLL